jgi:hypothetical protein
MPNNSAEFSLDDSAPMKHIATINFEDADGGGAASAIVRGDGDRVVIALSLMSDGDLQVVMPREVAEQFHSAVGEASRPSQ